MKHDHPSRRNSCLASNSFLVYLPRAPCSFQWLASIRAAPATTLPSLQIVCRMQTRPMGNTNVLRLLLRARTMTNAATNALPIPMVAPASNCPWAGKDAFRLVLSMKIARLRPRIFRPCIAMREFACRLRHLQEVRAVLRRLLRHLRPIERPYGVVVFSATSSSRSFCMRSISLL